jgi:hypothetical protein
MKSYYLSCSCLSSRSYTELKVWTIPYLIQITAFCDKNNIVFGASIWSDPRAHNAIVPFCVNFDTDYRICLSICSCALIFVLYKYFNMYLCHDLSYFHTSRGQPCWQCSICYWNNSHSSEILFRYFICGGMERLVRILVLQKRNYVRQIWLCLERYFTTHKASILNYITPFWWWVTFFFQPMGLVRNSFLKRGAGYTDKAVVIRYHTNRWDIY